jgi:transposase-like protein
MPRRRPTRTLADVSVRGLREALRTTPTLRAVAQRYGVSDNALRYWCVKLGLAPPRRPRLGRAHRAQLLRTLAALPLGATIAELRCRLPLSPSACNYALRCLEASGHVCRRLEAVPYPGCRRLRWWVVR